MAAPGVSPTISVVIAAYEAAGTIGETVESVLAQDPAPDEVIVADDGSTDRLEQALSPYEGRVEVMRLPHGGVAAARNVASRRAGGEFILFLDADDVLLPGKVASLLSLAEREPRFDVLGTDLYFERDGRRAGRFGDANPFPAEGEQRLTILERCFVAQIAVRRSRLLAIGGFDESLRSGSDWDCVLRLVLDGSPVGFAPEPLAVYRIRDGSLTSSRARTFRDRARILEKVLNNPNLLPAERPVAEKLLAAQKARATLGEAQEAVAAGHSDARHRCLRLALTPAAPRDRAWGLAVALAPKVLRPRLERGVDATSQLWRRLPSAGVGKTPAVSVIMAVRNGEQFLAEAVMSVLTQTWQDLELIVLDDGSTDATPEILESLAREDPRVVVHTKEPGRSLHRPSTSGRGLPRRLCSPGSTPTTSPCSIVSSSSSASLPSIPRLRYWEARRC